MSDSGESGNMSDTGDSRTTSDMGDSSAFSDWSLVDKHGELGDDDTTSTSSSVEVVDDDDDSNISPVTPVAGSPSDVAPRFILRLPSHKQDASDTDEDQTEGVTNEGVLQQLETISSAGAKAGQDYRQSTSEARVSQEQLEELRRTLDTLKRNLQPSQAEDCSLSSGELFGNGRSDKDILKTDSDLLPHRQVDNIHGTLQDGNLSMESSVSSSYSFLSRDADRQNSVGDQPDDNGVSPERDISNTQEEQAVSIHKSPERQTEQGTVSQDSETGTRSALGVLLSQFVQYPVKYIFLAGLASFMGVVMVTVLCTYKQGPDITTEAGALGQCQIDSQKLQIKLGRCIDNLSESKAMIETKDENMKALLGEKEEISVQLADSEMKTVRLKGRLKKLREENQSIKETHEKLLEENERLQDIADQSETQCAEWKQNLDKCSTNSDQTKHQYILDAEKNLAGVQRQCQSDLDKLRSQYQFEIDGVNWQYQSDLDRVRKQYQSDLDQVRKDYQSDLDQNRKHYQTDLELVKEDYRSELDRIRMHTKTSEKYTKSHCTKDEKQHDGHCKAESKHGSGEDSTQSVPNKSEQNKKTEQNKQEKQETTRSDKPKMGKGKQGKQTRSERQSGGTKHGNKQSNNDQNRKDNSDKKSSKGDNSGSDWADIILDIMNKTREQIQDTWTKVKNMSESLWQEHQPTLQRLHNSFSKKFQHLSKKFQDKLTRKMNKWFRRGKKHGQQEPKQAKTKRRHYSTDDDVTSSNSTVEERLVKLSHQVEALNARKFKQWRETPKVLDIQSDFKQVNILVNKGDQQQMEKNKLTDGYIDWLSCQFRWWKNLDAVAVADDCYLSLCCWQVKVTGGDVKGCRKEKRKQRIVEDSCALEPIHKSHTSGSHHQNKKTGSTKNKFHKSDHIRQQRFNTPDNSDGIVDQEPGSNGPKKENWFLAKEEDREYHREEPDNCFFRRKQTTFENDRKTDRSKDLYEEDFDDDVGDAYHGDADCDFHTGHCFYP